MIQLDNATRKYGDFVAVDSLSFSIKPESGITALLGPNGAGKSTTMRMMTGYLRPDSGDIQILGHFLRDSGALEKVKKNIGYLPETSPLYPEMLVSEYLEFIGRVRGLKGEKLNERALQMVEKLELHSHLYTPIAHLSRGFRQRVALAGSLIHDPDVIILDEPTSGLDPNQIEHIRKIIKDLGKQRTVVLSTHILQEVEDLCDHVIILHRGKKVADDTKQNLTRSNHLRMKLKGANMETLKSFAGVFSVLSVAEDRDGFQVIVCDIQNHPPEEIYRELQKTDWIVREFHPLSRSLHDLFGQLTL